MIYDLSNKLDQERFKAKVNHLFEKGKKVEIKAKRTKRTYKQNAYLHLILSMYGLEQGYTLEETKQEVFKRHVCQDIFKYKKGIHIFYKSTAELDTKQMTIAIDKFRNHASNDCGIYLPEPNENEKLQAMESHLEKYGNAQYL